MNSEKEAWVQLQEIACLQLKPDFVQRTLAYASKKAESRNQKRIMVLTGIICFVGIICYHWFNTSITHVANLKKWNENKIIIAQIENTY